MKKTTTVKSILRNLALALALGYFASLPLLSLAITDTQPPTVSIVSPQNGLTVSGTASISVNASDTSVAPGACIIILFGVQYDVTALQTAHSGGNIFNCGTDMTATYQSRHGTNVNRMQPYLVPQAGIARVEFYIDAVLAASKTASPYSYSWNTSAAANGSHNISAKAFDLAGNSANSSPISVTVNNAPAPSPSPSPAPSPSPSPSLLPSPSPTPSPSPSPSPSSSPSPSPSPTPSLLVFIEADLRAYDGTNPNLPIYIGLNGKVYDVTAGSEFYAPGGPYHYLAGRDSSAELNQFGGDIIASKYPVVGILILPLAVEITTPANFSTVGRGLVSVEANASGSVGIAKVEFYVDGILKGTDASAPYNYLWKITSERKGAHVLQAKAYDTANRAVTSTAVNVYVQKKSANSTDKIRIEKWQRIIKYIKKIMKSEEEDDDQKQGYHKFIGEKTIKILGEMISDLQEKNKED